MDRETISFQELYSRYADDVYRFSSWLTADLDEAKDITSETFVRVWLAKNDLRVETVKAYLFAIARNLWLKDKRRKKRLSSIDEEGDSDMPDESSGPEALTEVRLDLDKTIKAIQKLPEIERTVVVMRAQDDLSYEDIAGATGLSVATVKIKIFRARAKIQSLVMMEQGE